MRSFEIDHTRLTPGIYKNSVSGLVTIWDVRMKSPNKGDYLTPQQLHTIEHTLKAYMKYRYGKYRVLGVFPMGCQTGFYVLTRFIDSHMIHEAIIDYIMHTMKISSVVGANEMQCGQVTLQDLAGTKILLMSYYEDYLRFTHSASRY